MATNVKKPSPDHPHRVAKRKCLRCHSSFMSSWEGERICKRCKDSHVWRLPAAQDQPALDGLKSVIEFSQAAFKPPKAGPARCPTARCLFIVYEESNDWRTGLRCRMQCRIVGRAQVLAKPDNYWWAGGHVSQCHGARQKLVGFASRISTEIYHAHRLSQPTCAL